MDLNQKYKVSLPLCEVLGILWDLDIVCFSNKTLSQKLETLSRVVEGRTSI